jgi:uncharacterized protein YndB with AHSA1/START domain
MTEKSSLSLIARRTVRAPPERVFEVWTRPSELLHWWGPRGVECVGAEVDLRVGGAYRLGNRFADGRVVWISGTFELIELPHRLVYSWHVEPASEQLERVTVRFDPHPEGTEVIVIHEQIGSQRAREEHATGWEGCLDGLVARLVI